MSHLDGAQVAFPRWQASRLITRGYWRSAAACVNGQVAVPGGGQLKVPTPRVDQVLVRVVPPLARAWRMR